MPGYVATKGSCLQLLEQSYATHEAGETFAALRQRLLTKLQAARKRLKNTVASLQSQLNACQAHEDVRKRADLLMANVYRCVGGGGCGFACTATQCRLNHYTNGYTHKEEEEECDDTKKNMHDTMKNMMILRI